VEVTIGNDVLEVAPKEIEDDVRRGQAHQWFVDIVNRADEGAGVGDEDKKGDEQKELPEEKRYTHRWTIGLNSGPGLCPMERTSVCTAPIMG